MITYYYIPVLLIGGVGVLLLICILKGLAKREYKKGITLVAFFFLLDGILMGLSVYWNRMEFMFTLMGVPFGLWIMYMGWSMAGDIRRFSMRAEGVFLRVYEFRGCRSYNSHQKLIFCYETDGKAYDLESDDFYDSKWIEKRYEVGFTYPIWIDPKTVKERKQLRVKRCFACGSVLVLLVLGISMLCVGIKPILQYLEISIS